MEGKLHIITNIENYNTINQCGSDMHLKQKFKYCVLTNEGEHKKGIIIAHEISSVALFLRKQDYWIIDIKEVSSKKNIFNIFQKKASAKDLAVFSRHFASLINTGVPVLKSLIILSKQSENKKFAHALTQVISDLKAGTSLSEALTAYPQFFPKVFISMIAAGEAGGVLGEVLNRLALHFENIYTLTERVKTAIAYPALVIVIALLSVVLMMTMVLPVFENMLINVNASTLPLLTRIVIMSNKLLLHYWYYISGIFLICCFAFVIWVKTAKGKEILDYLIVRIPIIGGLLQKIILARFCQTFSTLIHSGVPIITALQIVKETIGNTVIMRAVSQACQYIEKGESIAVPLQKYAFFPPIVTHMIAVGEETGTLGELLEKTASIFDGDIDAAVSRISSLIEPLLVLLIGGIVGFTVISILLPVYQAISNI